MVCPSRIRSSFLCFWLISHAVLLCLAQETIVTEGALSSDQKCEPISIGLCMDIHYNMTIMPNLLNHQKQKDAGEELYHFAPLIKVKCSEDLQLFLCTVYVPVCTILDRPLPPCRSLCESARSGCLDVLEKFGYEWPRNLECSRFPEYGNLCFDKENGSRTSVPPTYMQPTVPNVPQYPSQQLSFICPIQFKTPQGYDEYSLRVGTKVEKHCGAPCNGMFFSQDQRAFSSLWIFGWSVCCLVSCSFTIATFLIEMSRFKYPERPIIFLSICYFMVALCYVFGFAFGDNIACNTPFPPPPGREELAQDMARLIAQGTKKESCTILFMMLYYFTMASYVWWCVLALTWFLSAGLKWGHEAIESRCHYFHMAAWVIPAIKTIAILSLNSVEGDILSGVCFVGIWNVDALRGFVLAPLVLYLVLGTAFLVSSFISLFRIKRIMKLEGASTDKLGKLMSRIGTFSALFVVPASIVVGCLFYEQTFFASWMLTWQRDKCRLREYAIPCPLRDEARPDVEYRPDFSVFMLKYFMALFVGITSGFWTWSSKTLNSWLRFYHRVVGYCCRSSRSPDGGRRSKFRSTRGGVEDESLHLDVKYGPRTSNRQEGFV